MESKFVRLIKRTEFPWNTIRNSKANSGHVPEIPIENSKAQSLLIRNLECEFFEVER